MCVCVCVCAHVCVYVCARTAGVLLANVFRSLILVLIKRRVLLIWVLMLWFAA